MSQPDSRSYESCQENDSSSKLNNRSQPSELFINDPTLKRKRHDSVEEIVEGDPLAGVEDGNGVPYEPKVELEEIEVEPADMLDFHFEDPSNDNEEALPTHLYLEDFSPSGEVNPAFSSGEENTSNAQTYMCNVCNSVFMRRSRLRIHMRRKHNLLKQTFQYNCDICGESYDQKTSLLAHMKRRHGPEPPIGDDKIEVTCDICGSILIGKRRLRFHKQRMHKIEESFSTFKCPFCPRTYDRASSLKMHKKRKHNSYRKVNQDIACPLCPKQFKNRPSYMAHLSRKHHGKSAPATLETSNDSNVEPGNVSKNFLCSICNSMFLNPNRLRLHMRRKHDLFQHAFNYNCNICGECYDQKNSLKAHMKRRHGPNEFIEDDKTEVACNVCGCVLVGKRRLLFHMQRIHNMENEPSKFKCLSCPRTYDKPSSLYMHTKRKHMPNSRKPEDIPCTLCPKRFKSRPSYMAHLKRTHLSGNELKVKKMTSSDLSINDEGNNPLTCSQCPLHFSDVKLLTDHMKTHYPNTLQYKCSFCSLAYDKRASLIQHVTRKHNEELFCKTCKKQFTSHEMFLNHSHANASVGQQTPVYQCGICKMIYVREGSLAKHMRLSHNIVTSDMTLFCEVCGKGFWKQCYLNTHMKTHSGASFPCHVCPKTFKVKDTLKQHISRHHVTALQLPCQHCGSSFMNEKDLLDHVTLAHSTKGIPNVKSEEGDDKNKIKSEEGHSNFDKSPQSAEDHLNNLLRCPECEEYFDNESELQCHREIVHRIGDDANEVVCKHCGLVTTDPLLNKHMVAEHSDVVEIFKCKHCYYKSWKKNLLWKHEQSHTLEKKFSCTVDGCSYKSHSKYRLQKHSTTHGEKVKLFCSQCSYSTNDPYIMKNHENEHVTGRKRYACGQCDYTTNYPANINIHRFKHSDVRSFRCKQCEFTTKYPTSMNIHKRKCHSDTSVGLAEQETLNLTPGKEVDEKIEPLAT